MQKPIMKILYCTDLSKNGKGVFDYAVNLSDTLNAEVEVLYVIEKIAEEQLVTLRAYSVDDISPSEFKKKYIDLAKNEFKKCLENFWNDASEEKKHLRKNVTNETVIQGNIAEAIVQHTKNGYDLVIIGSNRKFIGDTVKRVLRGVKIPVLVVPIIKK